MTRTHRRILIALAVVFALLFTWPAFYGLWIVARHTEFLVNCNDPKNRERVECLALVAKPKKDDGGQVVPGPVGGVPLGSGLEWVP